MSGRNAAVARLLWRSTGHKHKSLPVGTATMVKRHKVSTEAIDFKPNHSAKTLQAWKYPSSKIVRAPSKRLGSKDYYDPKDTNLPRRKQESNFFVTINSNKSLEGSLLELGYEHMENVLDYLAKDNTVAIYLRYGPNAKNVKADEVYLDDRYADVIHSVDWQACVETGPHKNRLHAHIWVTITHYSQIQLNTQMLMHMVKKVFNDPTLGPNKKGLQRLPTTSDLYIRKQPYVHIKLLPQSDWTSIMKQYIHKGMHPSQT